MINAVDSSSSIKSFSLEDSKKYKNKVDHICRMIGWINYGVNWSALTISLAASLILSSAVASTAALVSALALGLLITSRWIDIWSPRFPKALRRLIAVIKALVYDLLLAPLYSYLFLFKKNAAKEERLLQKELLVKRASVAAGATPAPTPTRPILLVHGYSGNSATWFYIQKALRAEGYGPVYTIDLGSPCQSIAYYAQAVKAKAETIAELHGRKDLTLIGYSMGGIVNTYYQQFLAPQNSVKDNLLIATPARGSYLAYAGLALSLGCSQSLHNMTPQSAFIKALEAKVKESGYQAIFSLTSQADQVVLPNRFTVFKGLPEEQKKVFESMGHLQFLFSGEVIDTILARLAETHRNQAQDIMVFD